MRIFGTKQIAMVAALAAVAAVATPLRAADPTVVGLWQKIDDTTGKPMGWFLFVDKGGTFEGLIAKGFAKPGEELPSRCTACTDDRKNAPMLGLAFIRNMQRSGLKYENGSVLDPRDGKIYNAMMTLSADGKTLTMRGDRTDPMTGQTGKMRTVTTIADKDHYTLEWYMTGADGKEEKVVTLVHTRKRP